MAESTKDQAADAVKNTAAKAKAAAQAATPTSAKDAADKAKDAAYTVVGLGVLGFNKAQAGARQLVTAVKSKDLNGHVSTIKEQAGSVAKKADEQFEAVITKVEEKTQPLEEKLPEQARNLVKKAQDTGRDTRAKVRAKVFSS